MLRRMMLGRIYRRAATQHTDVADAPDPGGYLYTKSVSILFIRVYPCPIQLTFYTIRSLPRHAQPTTAQVVVHRDAQEQQKPADPHACEGPGQLTAPSQMHKD